MKMSALLGAALMSIMARGGWPTQPTLRTNQTRRNKQSLSTSYDRSYSCTADPRWWHDLKDVNQMQAKADAALRRLDRAQKLNNWAESVKPNPFYNAQ